MIGSVRAGAAAIVLWFLAISPAAAELCRVSFAHPSLGSDGLSLLVEKALLYINDGPARGTAFLIDRHRGIYLTAAHVVAAKADYRIAENRETIFLNSRNPRLSGDRISLKVLTILTEDENSRSGVPAYALDDLAILQLRDFELPSNVQPLELALRKPVSYPRDRVHFTGYGVTRPEDPRPRIIDDNQTPLEPLSHNVYGIGETVEGGDSGGPVLLGNGNVIGLIMRAQDRHQAIIHPLDRYRLAIMDEVVPEGDRLIEVLFASQDLDQRIIDAIGLLQPAPAAISNLEWASAILKLDTLGLLADVDTELLHCPLVMAATQRQIGAYGGFITREIVLREYRSAEPAEVLNEGQRAEQRGEALRAIALYELASDGYRRQVASLMGEESVQRALAGSLIRASETALPGELEGINGTTWSFQATVDTLAERLDVTAPADIVVDVTPQTSPRFRTFTSDRLAVALNDYGRALARGNNLRAQISGADFVDLASQETAIRATAIGATVAGSTSWRQLNLDTLQYSLTGHHAETGAADRIGIDVRTMAVRPNDRVLFDLGSSSHWPGD
jgi:hypothetical protein